MRAKRVFQLLIIGAILSVIYLSFLLILDIRDPLRQVYHEQDYDMSVNLSNIVISNDSILLSFEDYRISFKELELYNEGELEIIIEDVLTRFNVSVPVECYGVDTNVLSYDTVYYYNLLFNCHHYLLLNISITGYLGTKEKM